MTEKNADPQSDIDEADRRNGEPGATDHPVGDEQAEKNRREDPPA